MSLELTRKIQSTFDLAGLRHEAEMLEQKRQAQNQEAQLQAQGEGQDLSTDWRKLREIKEEHQQARDDIQAHYRESHDERMEIAREAVRKTLATAKLQPRPPQAIGAVRPAQFNNELIERRAEKLVERDLQRDLLTIDLSEAGALKAHLQGPFTSESAQHREGRSYDTDRAIEQDRTGDPGEAQSQNQSQNRSLAQSFQPSR